MTGRRVRAGVAALAAALGLGVATAGAALADDPATGPSATSLPARWFGDVQAVAIRIEADEPLPAGTGDLPNISGQVNGTEKTSLLTSAADLLGPVTGPHVVEPTSGVSTGLSDPQASCQYPSGPLDASQSYPLSGADEPTVESQATCGAGPSASGTAYSAAGSTVFASYGGSAGHALLGPNPGLGAVVVSADAEASKVDIPGVLSVASVMASGSSQASGRPGGAATSAQVTVSGLQVGGQTISLDRNGLSVGGGAPVPVGAAQPVVDSLNSALGSSGCSLTLLKNPPTYPQGPLFERPPLPDRVNPDGTDAGSTAGGMVVRCLVPDALNPTNFKPLILQVLLGFVATEADAFTTAAGTGFSSAVPADLGASAAVVTPTTAPSPPSDAVPSSPAPVAPTPATDATATVTPPTTSPPGPTAAPPSAGAAPPAPVAAPAELIRATPPLRSGLEVGGGLVALALGALGVWLLGPWRVRLADPHHPEMQP